MIQEYYVNEPWKLLVGCILLNRTTGRQVKQVIEKLFEEYPTVHALATANELGVSNIIASLGFKNKRAYTLIKFAKIWICGFEDVSELPGIGEYARDSYAIFVEKRLDTEPLDKQLLLYLDRERAKLRKNLKLWKESTQQIMLRDVSQ